MRISFSFKPLCLLYILKFSHQISVSTLTVFTIRWLDKVCLIARTECERWWKFISPHHAPDTLSGPLSGPPSQSTWLLGNVRKCRPFQTICYGVKVVLPFNSRYQHPIAYSDPHSFGACGLSLLFLTDWMHQQGDEPLVRNNTWSIDYSQTHDFGLPCIFSSILDGVTLFGKTTVYWICQIRDAIATVFQHVHPVVCARKYKSVQVSSLALLRAPLPVNDVKQLARFRC